MIWPQVSIGITPLLLTIAAFSLPLISLVVKRRLFYHIYALAFTIVALLFASVNFYLVNYVYGHPLVYLFGGWPGPLGIVYEIDGVGSVLGLLMALDMLLVVIYSWWYMKNEDGVEWYYTLLLLLETGMLGIVYTGDIFNLFVMIEVLAISAYGLVAFYRSKREAIEASIKYSIVGATATTMYFLSVVFIYGTYGTVNMADLALKARPWLTSTLAPAYSFLSNMSGVGYGNVFIASAIALALALWAFTFKSAVFPNHFWLPDAHPEAPTPVSAALSGLVVKMGAYATLRFMYTIFGSNSTLDIGGGMSLRDAILLIILILGAVSAILGALVMIIQDDIKRLLAYSTIAHLGIIFMGLGVGLRGVSTALTSMAIAGVVLHTINHSFGKTLLFMASGLYIKATGTRNINLMKGLGKIMPVTTALVILGLLHLLGVPPLGGFFSKLLIYNALINSGLAIFAIILILSTAISILGYMKLIVTLLVPPKPIEFLGKIREEALPITVLSILAGLVILVGILSVIGGIDVLERIAGGTTSVNGIIDYINTMVKTSMKLVGGS